MLRRGEGRGREGGGGERQADASLQDDFFISGFKRSGRCSLTGIIIVRKISEKGVKREGGGAGGLTREERRRRLAMSELA